MSFDRSRLPDPLDYFDREGVSLSGKGKWRSAPCPRCGSRDNLRINTASGGHVCMGGCGLKGGDVLAYHMQVHGMDVVDACKALGAWVDDGKPSTAKPLPFSARSGLEVVRAEALLAAVAAANLARGVQLSPEDRARLAQAAGRLNYIAEAIST
jgi:hypothetical protein